MIEVVLADAEQAFKPLSPVKFNVDRLETNPRFAAISRPANAAILVRLRIDMEDRGGIVEMLLPYATIEPIRDVLLQMFMGEKFGRDPIWEGHLATEIGQAEIAVDAVLYEAQAAAAAADEARGRRHADARTQAGRAGDGALRRRRADRRPHGPRRRPGRGARRRSRCASPAPRSPCSKMPRTLEPIGGTVSHILGLMIESLVAVLLLLTIGYCVLLNRRLRRLRADELSLKATIAELITATEIAERAIGGLKQTVRECDENLGERLRTAERVSAELGRQLDGGEELLKRDRPVAGSRQLGSNPRRATPRRCWRPHRPLPRARRGAAA